MSAWNGGGGAGVQARARRRAQEAVQEEGLRERNTDARSPSPCIACYRWRLALSPPPPPLRTAPLAYTRSRHPIVSFLRLTGDVNADVGCGEGEGKGRRHTVVAQRTRLGIALLLPSTYSPRHASGEARRHPRGLGVGKTALDILFRLQRWPRDGWLEAQLWRKKRCLEF